MKLMTKFSNKFKKNLSLAYFADKFFCSKNLAVTQNTTWASNTMLSFRKKLMSQSKENV